MLRITFIISLTLLVNSTFAQTNTDKNQIERKGFVFGLGIGAGALSLHTNGASNTSFSASLPNIRLGYMLNDRFALLALFPGATYQFEDKTRGFEALMLAGQYWIKDKWWVMGGTGLTFDAPAFYAVEDPQTAGFYTGFPALTFATGYEIWRKGRFTVDLQYRIFYGKSELPNNGQREGISNMFILGFNWY